MRFITSVLFVVLVLFVLLGGPLAHAQTTPAEYAKAIQEYSRAIEKNAKDADALNGRALAHEAAGRDVLALQDYSAFIKVNPKSAHGFERRATIYFRMGEFARAGSDYTAAVFLDSRNAAALFGLGMTQRMDRFNPAGSSEERIAAALKIQPDIAARMAERGVK